MQTTEIADGSKLIDFGGIQLAGNCIQITFRGIRSRCLGTVDAGSAGLVLLGHCKLPASGKVGELSFAYIEPAGEMSGFVAAKTCAHTYPECALNLPRSGLLIRPWLIETMLHEAWPAENLCQATGL